MKVEIKEGALIMTPVTEKEERLIFALAAAYQAFNSVLYPVTAQAVRYTEDSSTQSVPVHHHRESEERHPGTQQCECNRGD